MKYMHTQHKHIKTVLAVVFALLAALMPVAKDLHVNFHVQTEVSGEAVSEDCPLCNVEFPAFEAAEDDVEFSAVEREYVVFVPLFLGNVCDRCADDFVIRGPPTANGFIF